MPKPPSTHDLHLRGGRFQPLSYDTMTPEQKALADSILAGPRTSLDGPFNVLLRSPEMGDLAQKFGAYVRYHSSLPPRLNEFAILITARQWKAQFEWQAHRKYALTAGLKPAIIDALAAGKRPRIHAGRRRNRLQFLHRGAHYQTRRRRRPSKPPRKSSASAAWWTCWASWATTSSSRCC